MIDKAKLTLIAAINGVEHRAASGRARPERLHDRHRRE